MSEKEEETREGGKKEITEKNQNGENMLCVCVSERDSVWCFCMCVCVSEIVSYFFKVRMRNGSRK